MNINILDQYGDLLFVLYNVGEPAYSWLTDRPPATSSERNWLNIVSMISTTDCWQLLYNPRLIIKQCDKIIIAAVIIACTTVQWWLPATSMAYALYLNIKWSDEEINEAGEAGGEVRPKLVPFAILSGGDWP